MQKFGLLPRLIVAIVFGIIFGAYAPEWTLRILVTFNSLFGSFLGFIIPLIIIGFIVPGIGELGAKAGKMLGITAGIAYTSTIIAGTLAYLAAVFILPNIIQVGSFLTGGVEGAEAIAIAPFIEFDMPPIMGVMSALLVAFILGLGIAAIKGDTLKRVMNDFQGIIEKVITKVIIPLLPIHILGIFAGMTYGGQVATVLSVFAKVFVMIVILHSLYLVAQYFIAAIIGGGNPFRLIRNMLPAYFTAIGTQSSAATIPVTVRQTKKNGVNEGVAEFAVPLCATIHLSGSTITLVSCSLAVMMLMDMPISLATYFPFILMLGITMVAAPGVPGGAVMAAIGLLESMLLFDPTMVALMIALYLAQDSFGTACNVTGDGAIAVMVNRISGHSLQRL
jgi:Na+/H+-dicarboxylate symporter